MSIPVTARNPVLWAEANQGSGFFQQQAATHTRENCVEPTHSDQPESL